MKIYRYSRALCWEKWMLIVHRVPNNRFSNFYNSHVVLFLFSLPTVEGIIPFTLGLGGHCLYAPSQSSVSNCGNKGDFYSNVRIHTQKWSGVNACYRQFDIYGMGILHISRALWCIAENVLLIFMWFI